MMLARVLFLLVSGCSLVGRAADPESLTLHLTRTFDQAWDRGDLDALYALFDPDCIYQTPFRTEIGRDAVRDHVFRNVARFRDSVSTEDYSKVEGDMAYSTGTTTFNEYDGNGAVKARWVSRYLHVFTRRPGEDWKMRFHVVHEEVPPPRPAHAGETPAPATGQPSGAVRPHAVAATLNRVCAAHANASGQVADPMLVTVRGARRGGASTHPSAL